MSAMASQITSLAIVHSTVYSGAGQRKHQSSASLAFVRASDAENVSILMTSSWNKNIIKLGHFRTVARTTNQCGVGWGWGGVGGVGGGWGGGVIYSLVSLYNVVLTKYHYIVLSTCEGHDAENISILMTSSWNENIIKLGHFRTVARTTNQWGGGGGY